MASGSSSSSSVVGVAAVYEFKIAGVDVKTTVANEPWQISYLFNNEAIINKDDTLVSLHVESNRFGSKLRIGTLQLCFGTRCLLIQLNQLSRLDKDIPASLKRFLADTKVTFVGINTDGFLAELEVKYSLKCKNWKEMGGVIEVYCRNKKIISGSSDGLVNFARVYVGLDLEKTKSVINSYWDDNKLTTEQIYYATLDAYASYLIGGKLLSGFFPMLED